MLYDSLQLLSKLNLLFSLFRKPVQEEKNKKKGFCECCCVHYDDLDLVRNLRIILKRR